MRITEKHVNESHLEEVYQLIQKGKSIFGIDMEDVKSVLVGKEGILYEAYKDKGIENGAFMEEFFDTVKKMEMVQNGTGILFNITMPDDDQLMMEDMEIINCFLISFEEKDMMIRWGLRVGEQGSRTSILMICTKDRLSGCGDIVL